jgi:hypothetical protein
LNSYCKNFFNTYNTAINTAYNSYMRTIEAGPEETLSNSKEVEAYIAREYEKWLSNSFDELDRKTPGEFLKTIDNIDTLIEMFRYGAVVCDDDLPEIFVDKLKEFEDQVTEILLKIALEPANEGSDDELLAPIMAIRMLGRWHVERAVEPLISIIDTDKPLFDLLYETVKEALINIGMPAVDTICSTLDSGNMPQNSAEYLLMALAEIGRDNKCDRIYKQLKKAFLQMPQKIVPANCLANYGDGRAIPALRGFLEKNGKTIEKDTYYEIVSVIKRLGGCTDDLGI